MVYLQTTYGFREVYFQYFESCNFSSENTCTNIDVSVFMVDLRMINMSSECEYDWYWKISLANKLHILAQQADIFGINQFTSR
jgi:hypothetical protein